MRTRLLFVLAATSLVVGCTADDSAPSASSAGGAVSSTTVPTGPAPGVTDDAVKVGLLFVDTSALATAGVDLDLGDVEGAYHALVDDINADGGINGRMLDPVYTPVDPIGTEGADRACVEVSEDQQVFVAAGLFLADAVLCLVDTHQTAVIGGEMTPERLERAAAPWFTTGPGPDLDQAVLRAMDAAGELEGPVAVIAGTAEEAEITDVSPPAGRARRRRRRARGDRRTPGRPCCDLRPGAHDRRALRRRRGGVRDPPGRRRTDLAQRHGRPALPAPPRVPADRRWRPGVSPRRVPDGPVTAQGVDPGRELRPDQAVYDEARMRDCIEVIEDAGVDVPGPDEVDDDATPWIAAFQACPTMALLQAVLDAAGDDLNYGTLQAAGEGLGELPIPGDPAPRHYGPPPATDGDPPPTSSRGMPQPRSTSNSRTELRDPEPARLQQGQGPSASLAAMM